MFHFRAFSISAEGNRGATKKENTVTVDENEIKFPMLFSKPNPSKTTVPATKWKLCACYCLYSL